MTEPPLLRLGYSAMRRELQAASSLAKPFLTPTGARRLLGAEQTFAALASRPDTDVVWEIPLDEPIETNASPGEYERRRRRRQKGPDVRGALSFTWGLRTGPHPVREISLSGNVSTQLRLYDTYDGGPRELSMWRMEIGAHDSPGCCFHTQVLGREEHPPFPKSLPVPRLPSLPPTPMSCLEFLLSELFQEQWETRLERATEPANMWRGIQTRRLRSFLGWQLRQLDQATGSPLVRLKAFPSPETLLG
jgi:hypothetical protein